MKIMMRETLDSLWINIQYSGNLYITISISPQNSENKLELEFQNYDFPQYISTQILSASDFYGIKIIQ